MDPRTGVSPGLKVMVDRATRRKFAWQQSPLAACPQKVKDGVEDGTKVGGSRSPARSRSRQNWRNKSPRCVVHVGGVESNAHRTSYGPSGPDQRSFKTDVNFSNTLLVLRIQCSSVSFSSVESFISGAGRLIRPTLQLLRYHMQATTSIKEQQQRKIKTQPGFI